MDLYYKSTRNSNLKVTASEAILKGLAPDGGLFVPEKLPVLGKSMEELKDLNYQDTAYEVMKCFLTDFTEEELRNCIEKAYDSKFDDETIAPLVKVEDTYYIIWCQDFYGAAIGMAKTTDFKTFVRVENPFLPFNRNAVLFPRKINGNFVMLSRPSDSGHTPFGDIFLSESPDLTYWGKHRHVMGKSSEWWESLKIGGGAAPIETTEGWLLFYHGVSGTCNGYVYSIGGAILDIDNPSIVKYRCQNFLLTPEEWFEERGFVPNVTFPCATIHDAESGKIAIYYGCADTYVGLAFTEVDEIVSYIKEHSVVTEEDTEIG